MSEWREGDEERRMDREPKDLGWIKKALVTSCFAMLANFAGGIWWAATQTAKMDFVQASMIAIQQELNESNKDRYRASDATKDIAVLNSRIDRTETKLTTIERMIYSRSEKGAGL